MSLLSKFRLTIASAMKSTIKAGITYFALVLGAGIIMGSVRVPFLVPRLGERMAELVEMPVMFVIILLAARFITKKFSLPPSKSVRLAAGFLALGLSLLAEVLLAAVLQDQSIGEYIASRDPVSGGVYIAMLVLFAFMPLILARRQLASGVSSHERT
jgi:hypothetical protein